MTERTSTRLTPQFENPLMTLRVSRDSGRTFGREKRYYARDCNPPLLNGVYPPCMCPPCRGGKS